MLYDYVERKRKENSGAQLHVTYLVAGNLLQNGHVVSVSLLRGAPEPSVVVSLPPCFVVLGSKAELAFSSRSHSVPGLLDRYRIRLRVCPSVQTMGRKDQLVVDWEHRAE